MINGNTILVVLVTIYSFALPIGLAVWWRKRTGARLKPFFAGAICFTLFAMLLEQIPHFFLLNPDSAAGQTVMSSPWLYMLYASFAAGIFEETGRLYGFRLLLGKYNEREAAVSYGIGHGGIEVIFVLGATYVLMLLNVLGVSLGSEAADASLAATIAAITPGAALLACFERVSALMAHIGLSMTVFIAAKKPGRLMLYPAAIVLHALLDAPAALYQIGALKSIAVVEICAFVTGAAFLLLGKKLLDREFPAEKAGTAELREEKKA